MYFTGPYLRVLTPKTTNGILPLIINGEQQYREDFLPLTARKQLEAKNRRLQKSGNNHLLVDIEEVGSQPVFKEAAPAPAKRGPKPKNK
jgi:hypothetical protein